MGLRTTAAILCARILSLACRAAGKQGVTMAGKYAMKIDPKASGEEESSRDSLIIAIWDATPEQMNDYYSNQFEIICRLAGHALERAELTQEESRQA